MQHDVLSLRFYDQQFHNLKPYIKVMEKIQILWVSIAFPPKNDPECIQAGRFFKYLSREEDFVLDVVSSSDPTLFMPVDESLRSLDAGYRQKISVPIFETKFTNFLLRKIMMGFVMFPDSKMTFHWQYRSVLRQLKQKPDVLYSRSNPISSAFMAAALKRRLNIPWVMHFSDPWALSPLEAKNERKLAKEAMLIREADHVTFTTEGTLQLYAAHYPTSAFKFSVIPNVFDQDELSDYPEVHPEKFTLVYTGGLAGMRSLTFLDDALTKIKQKAPSVLDKIDIVVAGPMDRTNAAYFERTTFSCIRHCGMLSYQAAKNLQQRAHILLAVDNPTDTQGAIFFPSKLLDYFTAGKKILAITPENSASRKVLQEYQHSACFTTHEASAIADYLIAQIVTWASGHTPPRLAPPTKYAAKENAWHVAKLFRNAVA
jgi:glycosyltransferase involved in cell wall biosynthesis